MPTTNYDWFIENNLDKFSGKWIAIDNNQVLYSDIKLDSLLNKVKDKYPKSRPFISRVRNKLLRLHS